MKRAIYKKNSNYAFDYGEGGFFLSCLRAFNFFIMSRFRNLRTCKSQAESSQLVY